ncbi:RNA polymerase I specific transcription initiation factor RRN3 protein [Citrus sinensis]|nr:RNA polymerase I specific transcription initiation factor RRN3 protein [Citrus sinensis]
MGVELPIDHAESHEMEDVNISDLELVYHVREALTSVQSGDNDNYNQLVAVMHLSGRLDPDNRALLETSLKALSGAVSYIDISHHESLLVSIFGMSMWNYDPDVMDALKGLIISLAASNGKYVDSCLTMLVSNFTPPSYFLDKLKEPHGLERKHQVLSRVHAALKSIFDLVPLAPTRLLPIVVQRMPTVHNKHERLKMIVVYTENMLKLESSAMGELVRSTLLMAVVDRLIDLDMEIGWDDILHDDFSKGIFEMELEDVEEAADDAEQVGDELPSGSLSRKSLSGNLIAELLDSLMVLTFEHLESCEGTGRLIEVFEILLQSFQITVLNAYKSKFAQFVMFYACALDPENCGLRFATMLADVFVSGLYPPLTRMSAVSYLASFLSRARLVDWCLEYCNILGGDINPKAHRVFYSGCQAIMYVLCFRMRSIMDIPRLKSQLLLMPLETVLKHDLNPLKVCLPSVVSEFLQQSKAARLFTVSETFVFNDLLESELSRAFGGLERLDMFFPFDPCLLKKSDSFIRPNFVYWSMVKTAYHGDEEDNSDEDVDEDNGDHVMVDGVGRSPDEQDLDLDEFEYSLNKMSITPKNSFSCRCVARSAKGPQLRVDSKYLRRCCGLEGFQVHRMNHSHKFPRDGGLPTADAPGMNFGVVTEEDNGSGCIPDLDSFHPSAKKTTDDNL